MTAGTTTAPDVFDVRSPLTGEVIGTYPVHGPTDVAASVSRARLAGTWWDWLGFAERARRLDRWRGIIARRSDELAELVRAETGKPRADAMLEVVMALEHLAWAARNAKKVLGPRTVRSSLLMLNEAASVAHRPLGAVGVIGPWNYPVFTPLGSLSFALAAGNAVVYKPSAPGVGAWLVDAFAAVVPEQPVLQLLTGDGGTGAALCRSGVDKIGFTGSTATGKQVLAACAATLTPVLMECGGKDALIVDADADVAAAADAAVWGATSNAGQTCLGVERVYVHRAVHDEFVAEVVALARTIRAGTGPEARFGPMTTPGQVDVVRAHIADALDRGARVALGGLDAIDGRVVQPTILLDAPEDCLAVTEETFGPTMTIAKVRDADEAVQRANASRYALGLTVFSRRNGTRIAARIRSGAVAVNSYVGFAAIPNLPLGGVGDSGFGRVHGPEGLKEFTYARSMTRRRFRAPLPVTTFRRGPRVDRLIRVLVRLLHGRR
ncbi:aldehyde dehydrogenase family protein [Saccharopolyspora sp. NPDC002578]